MYDNDERSDLNTFLLEEENNVSVVRRSRGVKPSKMTIFICVFVMGLPLILVYSLSANGSNSINSVFRSKTFDKQQKFFEQNSIWTYHCQNQQCVRQLAATDETIITLETCNMMCSLPSLWPKPKSVKIISQNSSTFTADQISFQINATSEVTGRLTQAADLFKNNLPSTYKTPWPTNVDSSTVRVYIRVETNDIIPRISTNESYSLLVSKSDATVVVSILADTYCGARHGMETLSQLIWLDKSINTMKIYHDIEIHDSPAFPHRGLMIDTARNYFPVLKLLNILDGMAASKLNVFHLHLTDAVSFPIVLPKNPTFSKYGSYGEDMVYTTADIKGLIEYAHIRGIRVILEIDAPSHVNRGLNYGTDNGELVICGNEDITNGHLNPDNNNSLNILKSIYEDLLELGTDSETFHIGGDEVNTTCYGQTQAAKAYSSVQLFWAAFTNQIFETVKSANQGELPKNLVLWSSPLTDQYLSELNYKENIVVQYWYGQLPQIISSGHKIIFSTVSNWYLDCGFGPWKPSMTNGVCDPYRSWQSFYKYRPWSQFSANMDQVLGGEACLWSEQVDEFSLETRVWPRAAAFAERMWSDISTFDDYDVFTRLTTHRQRLLDRRLEAAGMWPRYCAQNPGKC